MFMIRSTIGYLQLHGFHVMMAGFSVVALCAAFFGLGISAHFMTQHLRNATFFCALGGLIVYTTGRILIIVDKRKQNRSSEHADATGEPS
jgi:hypothetical protein